MTTSETSEAAKAVIRRNTEEVQGGGNFEVFEELFADDFLDHTPGVQQRRRLDLNFRLGLQRRYACAQLLLSLWLHAAVLDGLRFFFVGSGAIRASSAFDVG